MLRAFLIPFLMMALIVLSGCDNSGPTEVADCAVERAERRDSK